MKSWTSLKPRLRAAERVLKPGGRLAVVSFHSLEDRIVKTFMVDRSQTGGGSRHRPEVRARRADLHRDQQDARSRPMTSEIAANPRARSAKLRGAERTDAPARADDDEGVDRTRCRRSMPRAGGA